MNRKLLVCGFVAGVLALTVSLLAITLKGSLFNYLISKETRLVPGTFLYEQWNSADTPVEILQSFYLFNVTNPDEFVRDGSKPTFNEVGPFVYKEVRTKENVTLNSNGTITYKERRRFYFMHKLSALNDDTPITSINMVVITAVNLIRSIPFASRSKVITGFVDAFLRMNSEQILITRSAKSLLFGYDDQLLTLLAKFNLVPNAKIAYFLNKNDTIDGEYTIFNGADDVNKVGKIERFNRMNVLPYWTSESANQINGTDSSVNYPFMNKSSTPYTFQPDICRSVYSVFNETAKTYHGIEMYGYILDEFFWANSTTNPSNAGFCTPASNCLARGIFNISRCVNLGSIEIPTYLSMPHFLFGDQQLVDNCPGLSPNFTKHRSIIYFEPLTGIPMKGNKRVQLNTKLSPDEKWPLIKNVPDMYFPLFWIEESFEIDTSLGDKFWHMVKLPNLLYDVFSYILVVIGAIGAASTFTLGLYKRNKRLRVYAYGPIGDDDTDNPVDIQQEQSNNDYNEQYVNSDERTPLI